MGETKQRQKDVKEELDRKLALSTPSRSLLEELAVESAKNPSLESTFQYAFALSKSNERSELRYAIQMLDGLVEQGYEHQIDCLYGVATAFYLLRDYAEARRRCEAILRAQPGARFAKELHLAAIEAEEERERDKIKKAAIGSIGMAAAVGVVGVAASLLFHKK